MENAQWRKLDPSMPRLASSMRAPTCTFVREQLLGDRDWYETEHVQDFRRVARVDSFIYSAHSDGGDTARSISLHRAWGDRAFSERERRLVDLFHRECAFLHAKRSAVNPALLRDLSPRLRDTLLALASGRSEKQIAADLKLSPHTVHEYVKALYKRFQVQSRSELLARCLASGS